MNIKEMHYDFKKKLNKIDSAQYRNLLIPEIDWVLNEAQEIFVKSIAEPHSYSYLGFEKSQRNTDDIRTLVKKSDITVNNGKINLPDDYMYFVSAKAIMNNACGDRQATIRIRQHDDDFESSPFDKSSYDWAMVNAVFEGNNLILFTDNTFVNRSVQLVYIKKPVYMHDAEDFNLTGYSLPNGNTLYGYQDCELPEQVHRDIVDLAVQIASGELETNGYQIHTRKVQSSLQ